MPSEKILSEKKQQVSKLTEKFKSAKSMVFADYRGLTVSQDTEFRAKLRKANVEYKVIKNSLMNFAAKECGLDALSEKLKGPTSVAISYDDLIAPAKVLVEFSKKYENLELKTGVLEGEVIDADKVKSLAALPSREVLISKMLGSMNAPVTGFVTVLNGTLKGLVVALNAISNQKEQ